MSTSTRTEGLVLQGSMSQTTGSIINVTHFKNISKKLYQYGSYSSDK